MSDKPFDDVEGDISQESTGESKPTPTQSADTQEETQGILDYITAETGTGSIEDYKDTPVNPRSDEGIAHLMRGVSGLVGKKVDNWALIDIFQGIYKFTIKDQNDQEAQEDEEVQQSETSEEIEA